MTSRIPRPEPMRARVACRLASVGLPHCRQVLLRRLQRRVVDAVLVAVAR